MFVMKWNGKKIHEKKEYFFFHRRWRRRRSRERKQWMNDCMKPQTSFEWHWKCNFYLFYIIRFFSLRLFCCFFSFRLLLLSLTQRWMSVPLRCGDNDNICATPYWTDKMGFFAISFQQWKYRTIFVLSLSHCFRSLWFHMRVCVCVCVRVSLNLIYDWMNFSTLQSAVYAWLNLHHVANGRIRWRWFAQTVTCVRGEMNPIH